MISAESVDIEFINELYENDASTRPPMISAESIIRPSPRPWTMKGFNEAADDLGGERWLGGCCSNRKAGDRQAPPSCDPLVA